VVRVIHTLTVGGRFAVSKTAVTALAPSMVTVQAPVPVHAPLHPANVEVSLPGEAVSDTTVPLAYDALQVEPQLIPAGVDVTVPEPDPVFVTVSVCRIANVAVTAFALFIVTVQAPVPVQAPLHPAKVDPTAGTAVRVTLVPEAYGELQSPSIPGGIEATVPAPSPLWSPSAILYPERHRGRGRATRPSLTVTVATAAPAG
jgi:hypothetical protein